MTQPKNSSYRDWTWEQALSAVLGVEMASRSDVTSMQWLVIKTDDDAEDTEDKPGELVLRFQAGKPKIGVYINMPDFVKPDGPWLRFAEKPLEQIRPAVESHRYGLLAANPRTLYDASIAFSRLRLWLDGAWRQFYTMYERMGADDAGWKGTSAGAFRDVAGNMSEGLTDLLDQLKGGSDAVAGERAFDVGLQRSSEELRRFIESTMLIYNGWTSTKDVTPWGAVDTAMDSNLTYFDKEGQGETVLNWRDTAFGDLAKPAAWHAIEAEAKRIWVANLENTLDSGIHASLDSLAKRYHETISTLRPIRPPTLAPVVAPEDLPGGDATSTDPLDQLADLLGGDGTAPTGDLPGGDPGMSIPDAGGLGAPGGVPGLASGDGSGTGVSVPDLSGPGVSAPGAGGGPVPGLGGDTQLPTVDTGSAPGVSFDPGAGTPGGLGGSGGVPFVPGGVGWPGSAGTPSTVPGAGRRPGTELPGTGVSVPSPDLPSPGVGADPGDGSGAGVSIPGGPDGDGIADGFQLPPSGSSVEGRAITGDGAGGSMPGAGGGSAGGADGTSQVVSSGRFVSPDGTGSGSGVAAGSAAGSGGGAGGTGTSAVPFFPPMAGMGMGAGQQPQERERTTWLAEDEKVWGTDPQAGPAVIGREPFDTETPDDAYPGDAARPGPTRTRSRR